MVFGVNAFAALLRFRIRRLVAVALCALSALVVSGCVNVEADLVLSDRDTVSGSLVQKINVEAIASVAQSFQGNFSSGTAGSSASPSQPADIAADIRADLVEGVAELNANLPEEYGFVASLFDDGQSLGVEVRFDEVPFADFSDVLTEAFASSEDLELGPGSSSNSGAQVPGSDSAGALASAAAEAFPLDLEFSRSGDVQSVTGTIGSSGAAAEGSLSGAAALGIVPMLYVSVTFPGEVLESNGSVEGSKVSWEITLGESKEVSASGSAVASGFSAGVLLWFLPVVVVVVAVAFFFVRARASAGPPAALPPLASMASVPSVAALRAASTVPPPSVAAVSEDFRPQLTAADVDRARAQPRSWLYMSDPAWGANPPIEGVIGAYWVDEFGQVTSVWQGNPQYRPAF